MVRSRLSVPPLANNILAVFPQHKLVASEGPVSSSRREQERVRLRDKEGILRPSEEVPPRHEQGPFCEGEVWRDPVGLRDPLRSQEEGAV